MSGRLRLTLSTELRQLELRLLRSRATSARCPFIGLFGRSGIMRSFNSIAAANSTSLARPSPRDRRCSIRASNGARRGDTRPSSSTTSFTVEMAASRGYAQGLIGRQRAGFSAASRWKGPERGNPAAPSGDPGGQRLRCRSPEITWTPMVDVMLVLLVILMVTAAVVDRGRARSTSMTSADGNHRAAKNRSSSRSNRPGEPLSARQVIGDD